MPIRELKKGRVVFILCFFMRTVFIILGFFFFLISDSGHISIVCFSVFCFLNKIRMEQKNVSKRSLVENVADNVDDMKRRKIGENSTSANDGVKSEAGPSVSVIPPSLWSARGAKPLDLSCVGKLLGCFRLFRNECNVFF